MQNFPASFEFYHLGPVELLPETQPATRAVPWLNLEHNRSVSFVISGSTVNRIVVLFDEDLDPSEYAELGNVIASRAAGLLSKEEGWSVMLSPPENRDAERTLRDLSPLSRFVSSTRTYLHRRPEGPTVSVTVAYISYPTTQASV